MTVLTRNEIKVGQVWHGRQTVTVVALDDYDNVVYSWTEDNVVHQHRRDWFNFQRHYSLEV